MIFQTNFQSASQKSARLLVSLLALSIAMPLASCADVQNNQNGILGAVGGGLLASGACMLARGNAATCAVIGVAGAVVGGAVGHAFDERDRARRDAALQQALNDQAMWAQPAPQAGQPDYSQAPQKKMPPQVVGTIAQPIKTSSVQQTSPTSAQDQQTTARSEGTPEVDWTNPDTNDSGAIVPLRTFASPASGKDCKVFREDYVRDGKQYSDTMQACPKTDGTGYDMKAAS